MRLGRNVQRRKLRYSVEKVEPYQKSLTQPGLANLAVSSAGSDATAPTAEMNHGVSIFFSSIAARQWGSERSATQRAARGLCTEPEAKPAKQI